ncbi:MAG: hypothetical protein FE041_01570 [Thermoplasmata archaeon]|nr:MAG: hypothetical protein FE041_01570 [Thermoplasmata archaeon]
MRHTIFVCAFVVLLMLTPAIYGGVGFTIDVKRAVNACRDYRNKGTLDQSQTQSDGGEKIYGSIMLAQSFKPNMDKMTGISIKIGKYLEKSSRMGNSNIEKNAKGNAKIAPKIDRIIPKLIKTNFIKIFKRFGRVSSLVTSLATPKSSTVLDDLGSLTIEIRERSHTGKILRSRTFTPEQISNNSGWIRFDFSKPIEYAFERKYCIVCYAEGGDSEHYYNWSYGSGDLYKEGYAHISRDGGEHWSGLSVDFCFKSYGENYSEEPDGITNRYGILIYMESASYAKESIKAMKEVLWQHGWNEDNIWIYERSQYWDIKITFRELDKKEDSDDILLFMYAGHTAWPFLDDYVKRLGAERMVVILDCCYAGQYSGRYPHAEMLMSSRADEESWASGGLRSGVFSYFVIMAIRSGYKTAEEIFNFAAPKTTATAYPDPQHPVFYDGYPGDIPVVE